MSSHPRDIVYLLIEAECLKQERDGVEVAKPTADRAELVRRAARLVRALEGSKS